MKILIIEDEIALADALLHTLNHNSYEAKAVHDGQMGLEEFTRGDYDAVILDLMLPKKDGLTVLKEARELGKMTPTLILTAFSDLDSRIKGLDCGANYYLTKPFETEELLACLRAITRTNTAPSDRGMSLGDLVLQPKRGSLYCSATQRSIKATAKEIQLMELFLTNRNLILSKEFLAENAWDVDSQAEYNNIEVYVSFLRKKLSTIGCHVKISTQRGLGYMLEETQT